LSSWTSPITFTSSTLTAAQINTEVRDHLNFLKGALDLLTGSTTADTGTTMNLKILRAASTDSALQTSQSGDATNRYLMAASGKMEWGDGTATRDTFLYRSAASVLTTDTFFEVGTSITMGSGVVFLEEITAPASAAANSCRIYAVDAAGKTRLSVIFPSGAAQTIATEP
jgi:hypothetical protein